MDKSRLELLMKQKIKLNDGSEANVVTQGTIPGAVNCQICRVANLGVENLKTHVMGKKHVKNLKSTPDPEIFYTPLEVKENSNSKYQH